MGMTLNEVYIFIAAATDNHKEELRHFSSKNAQLLAYQQRVQDMLDFASKHNCFIGDLIQEYPAFTSFQNAGSGHRIDLLMSRAQEGLETVVASQMFTQLQKMISDGKDHKEVVGAIRTISDSFGQTDAAPNMSITDVGFFSNQLKPLNVDDFIFTRKKDKHLLTKESGFIISGATGAGKSTFLAHFVIHAALSGNRVYVVTHETTNKTYNTRMIQMALGMNMETINAEVNSGKRTEEFYGRQVPEALNKLIQSRGGNIVFSGNNYPNAYDVLRAARSGNFDIVVVDTLKDLAVSTFGASDEYKALNGLMTTIKHRFIGKENMPLFVSSVQLNRSAETSSRTTMSTIAGSSNILRDIPYMIALKENPVALETNSTVFEIVKQRESSFKVLTDTIPGQLDPDTHRIIYNSNYCPLEEVIDVKELLELAEKC